jgi:hypothetical protein
MITNALHCLKYLDAKLLSTSVKDQPIICWLLNFQCVHMVIDAVKLLFADYPERPT